MITDARSQGAGYRYATHRSLSGVTDSRAAIEASVLNYFGDQLGWSDAQCRERVSLELERRIPRIYLSALERRGWKIKGARVLDVGAGQGAAVLELLERGANAYGVEPGPEFARVARMRLAEAGHDPERIVEAAGEQLPFPDNHFNHAISLQVLEHVPNSWAVLAELYRVLEPGGRAHVRCENYLAFHEQHYRVPWLPLMPKWIGSRYLRAIGRNPDFLNEYVYYTTYPQIRRIARQVGFRIIEADMTVERVPASRRDAPVRLALRYVIRWLPEGIEAAILAGRVHLKKTFGVGVVLDLMKPPRDAA